MDLSIKILIVDDYSSMRGVIRSTLKQIGFQDIIEAGDGKTAMKQLKYHNVDLIISDWKMPNMTGIDFLRAVRKDDKYKDKPFLMVTAESAAENVMDAIEAGVSNYIVKPFTAETMASKIEQIFKED